MIYADTIREAGTTWQEHLDEFVVVPCAALHRLPRMSQSDTNPGGQP